MHPKQIVFAFLTGCVALALGTLRDVERFREEIENLRNQFNQVFGLYEPMRFSPPRIIQKRWFPEQIFLIVSGCALILFSVVALFARL